VLRVMLPPVALTSLTTIDVPVGRSVGVPVEIIVVVNIDVAVVPIAIAPVAAGPSAQSKPCCTPRQSHAGIVSGISIGIIWIGRGRRPVNDLWVIRRHVNYVGLGWLDDDHLFAALDCFSLNRLLRAGF